MSSSSGNPFLVTLDDALKMNKNKFEGKSGGKENQQAIKQMTDKGLDDASFRKNDRSLASQVNEKKSKGFPSEIKEQLGKGQDNGPSNKKGRFLLDMPKTSTPLVDNFMGEDSSFRQLMNKINKPQYLKQGKDDSAKIVLFGDDFSAKSTGEISNIDNSSFRVEEAAKSNYDKEPSMEFGANFEENDYKNPTINPNQRPNERAQHGYKSDHGQQNIVLESAGLLNQTMTGIFNEQREIFETWGKILTKVEACEVKLLERGSVLKSEAEIMREKYEEQKEKFKRKLSALSHVLTKNYKQ